MASEVREQARQNSRRMTARVVSLEGGMQEYTDVSVIHIRSRYYNLLIMEGYTPSIGEIEGTVTIVSDTQSVKLENIRGFYLHKKDVFRVMIQEGESVDVQ
ncbi:MAG: hypothetical protein LUE31_05295 [Lachnospiraceae bacterium]|nr:hypothetical protein [Lachnospiraceae bacterium]